MQTFLFYQEHALLSFCSVVLHSLKKKEDKGAQQASGWQQAFVRACLPWT